MSGEIMICEGRFQDCIRMVPDGSVDLVEE